MSLNIQQLEAVKTVEGPMLIVAGAGSGKTAVLVNRIAYMIKEKCIEPENILAVTFTNKAAKEMKERVYNRVDHSQKELITISTFHSLCLNILKRESHRTSVVDLNFKLYEPDDCLTVIKQCIKDLGYQYSKKNKEDYVNPNSMANAISTFKNELVDSKTLIEEKQSLEYQDWKEVLKIISSYDYEELKIIYQVYSLYEKRMTKMNALDFDDLLYKTVLMFIKEQSILKKYQEKYKYIMVDEYQDTNRMQYLLVAKLLAEKYKNLAAVGDDCQGIYGWRFADIRNILNFEKDFPNARIVKLEQNYRSTKTIIQAANEVILNNINQIQKKLFTENSVGDKIKLYRAYSEHNEAAFVAHQIEEMRKEKGYEYGDFAILYRSNRKSGLIESMLNQQMIPNKVLSGMSFFNRSEIKDLLYYLRYIDDPNDPIFLQRIINLPKRNIGDTTVSKIIRLSEEKPLFSILETTEGLSRINQATKKGISEFFKSISKYYEMKKRISVSQLLESLIKELDLVNTVYFNDDKKKRKDREEAIEQFLVIAKGIESQNQNLTLRTFIEELVLDPGTEESEEGYVKLMTMHGSKGLEFPVVFLVGFDRYTFPSQQARTQSEIEEERRLCYVGMTRAKKELIITYPDALMVRNRNGFLEERSVGISNFVEEFDQELLEELETSYF